MKYIFALPLRRLRSFDVSMKYDPLKHHRRSVRLKNYAYDSPEAYFIPSEHEKTAIYWGIWLSDRWNCRLWDRSWNGI